MSRSVIVAAVRTPFGKLGGGLVAHSGDRARRDRDPRRARARRDRAGEPQYVIMGQVLQGGAGQAPARQAAIGAGLPIETPADTINKVCASSIRAVEIADSMIRAGDVELVVTGGMESMSNAPYVLDEGALRLPARRRDADRPDDARRARLDLRRPAHGRAGVVRLARARHLARGAGRVGAPLAPARGRRAATQGASTTSSSRSASSTPTRARAATRRSRSSPSLKPVFDPEGTTTAGNAPGRERRRLVRRRRERGVGASGAGSSRSRRSSRRATSPTSSPTSRARPRRPAAMALERAGKTIDDVAARRDQRGVLVGRAPLDEAARRRRGARERERRRRRARPSDRRLRRPHPRRRWCTSCAATAAGSASRRSAPAAARATRC